MHFLRSYIPVNPAIAFEISILIENRNSICQQAYPFSVLPDILYCEYSFWLILLFFLRFQKKLQTLFLLHQPA